MLDVVTEMNSRRDSSHWSEQMGATIQQRTHSQVRGLQLDVTEHEITVIGRVGSYHALHLVIEAVKVLQAEYRLPVRVQVQVFKRIATE